MKNQNVRKFLQLKSMTLEQYRSYIEENADNLDWTAISRHSLFLSLQFEFIWRFIDYWDWIGIPYLQSSDEFRKEFDEVIQIKVGPTVFRSWNTIIKVIKKNKIENQDSSSTT